MRIERQRLAILFAPPVVAGIILGANQTRAGAYLPWSLSIAYWMSITVATWLTFALATRIAESVLRPWQPPRWTAWLAGAVAGSFAARPLIYLIAEAFLPLMRQPTLRDMPPVEPTLAFLGYYITNWSLVIAMWLAASWMATRQAAAPAVVVTEPTPEPAAGSPPAPRGFLKRLPPAIGQEVIAVQSEDHYIRVHTPLGNALILGTISEAIETLGELGIDGQRVHRSWWVATGAVATTGLRGRRLFATLVNGVEVPVSQTYRELARRTGLLTTGPVALPG